MSKVAIVTGGSRGIGAAISIGLKNAGYRVAANYAGNDEAAQKFADYQPRAEKADWMAGGKRIRSMTLLPSLAAKRQVGGLAVEHHLAVLRGAGRHMHAGVAGIDQQMRGHAVVADPLVDRAQLVRALAAQRGHRRLVTLASPPCRAGSMPSE